MLHKLLHPLIVYIMQFTYTHEVRILNEHPEVHQNVIYAVNHSCCRDMPIASRIIRKHIYVLAGKQALKFVDWLALTLNGVIWVDRKDKESKRRAAAKMSQLLRRGENICMYPESTWNLTPSKPVLPLYWGIVDLARGERFLSFRLC